MVLIFTSTEQRSPPCKDLGPEEKRPSKVQKEIALLHGEKRGNGEEKERRGGAIERAHRRARPLLRARILDLKKKRHLGFRNRAGAREKREKERRGGALESSPVSGEGLWSPPPCEGGIPRGERGRRRLRAVETRVA